ncbi:hypothetical protein C9374_008255 [Naegleria lovaniensis]|uniref:Dipeptidyl peptidase 1 n=1 Tax=Naegleria lovaniensis TaxID=51637 RepID=A0AA88GK10_NAELO|nr:uncharacterized protein C9374_008255 [Naegleria lovaniensis]KAG2378616.1 hypothetical protein C9374_008255 [Naegleria lovaniensis]
MKHLTGPLLSFLLLWTCFIIQSFIVHADIPVSCEFPEVYGEWTFQKTETLYNNKVIDSKCSIDQPSLPSHVKLETFIVDLRVPDVALLKSKNGKLKKKGRWTLIFNQGVEIRLDGYKYFAFFNYTQDEKGEVTSNCDRVFVGTYHDDSIGAQRWGCFTAERTRAPTRARQFMKQQKLRDAMKKSSTSSDSILEGQYVRTIPEQASSQYQDMKQYVQAINKLNKWQAAFSHRFQGKSWSDLQLLNGNRVRRSSQLSRSFIQQEMLTSKKRNSQPFEKIRIYNGKTDQYEMVNEEELRKTLPQEFSWDNFHGRSYLTPVRDQKRCGSCYAFGTSEHLGMRVRIQTNLTQQWIYSPQAIVDCSPYSQGCRGGCVYLASKYAQDYGLALEECSPYNITMRSAQTCNITQCPLSKQRRALRTWNYYNVGGYYGGSDELNMMVDIWRNGPLVAGFMVHEDFFYYKSGIYQHIPKEQIAAQWSNASKDLPKFYYINHTLILYGWGIDATTGQQYWLARNSWGDQWGENGNVRILKGVNECGIESDAEAAIPLIL